MPQASKQNRKLNIVLIFFRRFRLWRRGRLWRRRESRHADTESRRPAIEGVRVGSCRIARSAARRL